MGRVRSDFLQFLAVGAFYVIIMGIHHIVPVITNRSSRKDPLGPPLPAE